MNMIPGTILSVSQLVSAVEEQSGRQFLGLEILLGALLQVSVSSEEGRFPRFYVLAEYEELTPLFVRYSGDLTDLAKLAHTAPYPEFALRCIWNDGKWTIMDVSQPTIHRDGLLINVNGPLSLSICLPNQLMPYIEIVRGKISKCDQSWQSLLAQLAHLARPIGSLRAGSTSALTIGRAVYKVSIRRHGGTFLVLPPNFKDCIEDLAIMHPATFGFEFEMLRESFGHPDNRRIEECSTVLAALAEVDGAVVFRNDLSLHGFNTTILTRFTDESDRTHRGHRHKSAQSFCSKHRGAISFVVSQDGPITVFGSLPDVAEESTKASRDLPA